MKCVDGQTHICHYISDLYICTKMNCSKQFLLEVVKEQCTILL